MGIFEFLMLCCFGFSWPFSIAKSLKSRSAKGKSLGFMLLVELGYVFGITHKILFRFITNNSKDVFHLLTKHQIAIIIFMRF